VSLTTSLSGVVVVEGDEEDEVDDSDTPAPSSAGASSVSWEAEESRLLTSISKVSSL